jgi:hypothetical protein
MEASVRSGALRSALSGISAAVTKITSNRSDEPMKTLSAPPLAAALASIILCCLAPGAGAQSAPPVAEPVLSPGAVAPDPALSPDAVRPDRALSPEQTDPGSVLAPGAVRPDPVLAPDQTDPAAVLAPGAVQPDPAYSPEQLNR